MQDWILKSASFMLTNGTCLHTKIPAQTPFPLSFCFLPFKASAVWLTCIQEFILINLCTLGLFDGIKGVRGRDTGALLSTKSALVLFHWGKWTHAIHL